jgi:hypothetical protein
MSTIDSRRHVGRVLVATACLSLAAPLLGCVQRVEQAAPTTGGQPEDMPGCDGEATVTVPEDLAGQELADALMAQWKRDHPGVDWVA